MTQLRLKSETSSAGSNPLRAPVRYVAAVAIVAAIYVLAARWGLEFWLTQGNVTLVWPPAGIALAALLIGGYRFLPAVAVGAFVATAWTGAPLALAVAAGVGNLLEALLGAWLLRRVTRLERGLGRVRDVLGLIVLAAGLSTTISATIGSWSVCSLGMAPWAGLTTIWFTWWVGDALGVVVITPVLLAWMDPSAPRWRALQIVEASTFFVLLAIYTYFVFDIRLTPGQDLVFMAYLPFPLMIWAAFRHGLRGATAATLIVSAIAVAGVSRGYGPFGPLSLQDGLSVLLTFVSVFAVTALMLAAALAERNQAEQALRQARDELARRVSERTVALTHVNAELAADVAERERAEREVRNLSKFPDENPQPVLRIARDGTINYANRSSALLLATWDRRLGELVPDDWRAWTTATLESGASREVGVTCGDRMLSFVLAPVGAGGYVIVYGRDITESKRASEARDRLATAVEQAAEGVVITDLKGGIEYVNPAFERITGYARAEVLGQNTRFLKSGQHDESFYRELWDTITRGAVWTGRFVNRRKDGTLYHEDATISPVRDGAGRIVNYVGLKRDVSREVMLEAQLRQSQKIEAVGQLAGGVAHEFNNLLTTILGHSEMVTLGVTPGHPAHGHAVHIRQATGRAAELVHQLLAFGRKQVVRPRVLNLNTVVCEALKLLRPLLGEQIRIETRLAPNLGFVQADQDQIEQLIANLGTNARDAMAQGGVLTIETTCVDLEEALQAEQESILPGRYVALSIQDTGCGMDAETRARVFEPFFTTKEVGRGTGMGLATVHGIVHQHGGRIVVHSVPGQGTTFRVYLPRVTEKEDRPGASGAAHRTRGGAATVLLVEDEDEVREVAQHILEAEGYTVLTAAHGAAALQVCAQYKARVDLLVTDVVMPRMGGRELAERLVRLHPETKVLYISGYAASFLSTEYRLEPGTAFLPKPFTRGTLAAKVRELLGASAAHHIYRNTGLLANSAS